MVGHIKLDRKILDWEWYQDANTFRLFIHLLLMANHKDAKWRGNVIQRGQLITGLDTLSTELHLTVMQIRTCFDKLKSTGEITIKVTNKFRVVTICKYDTYQSFKNENNNQTINQPNIEVTDSLTSKQQADNNQVTANNNDNNDNNNKEDNKINIYKPVAENFNGLPEIKVGSIVQYLKITKQKDITDDEVLGLWKVFKIQNLTGKKPYKDEDDVYSHFFNWVKDKKFENGTTNKQPNGVTKFNAGAIELLRKGKEQYAAITRQQDS